MYGTARDFARQERAYDELKAEAYDEQCRKDDEYQDKLQAQISDMVNEVQDNYAQPEHLRNKHQVAVYHDAFDSMCMENHDVLIEARYSEDFQEIFNDLLDKALYATCKVICE